MPVLSAMSVVPTASIRHPSVTAQAQEPIAIYRPASTNTTAIVVPLLVLLVVSAVAIYWFFRRRHLSPPNEHVSSSMRLADWFTNLASPQKRSKVKVVEIKTREVKQPEMRIAGRERKESKKGRKAPPVIDLRAAIQAGKQAARASEESYRRSKRRSEQKSQSIRLEESTTEHSKPEPPSEWQPKLASIEPKAKEKQKKPPSLLLAPLSPRAWRAQPSAHTSRWSKSSKSRPSTRATSSFFCAGPTTPAASAFTEVSTVYSEAEIKQVKRMKAAKGELVPALPVRKVASVDGHAPNDDMVADDGAKQREPREGSKDED